MFSRVDGQSEADEKRLRELQAEVKALEERLKRRRQAPPTTRPAETPATEEPPAVEETPSKQERSSGDSYYERIESLVATTLSTDVLDHLSPRIFHEMLFYNFVRGKGDQEIEQADVYEYFLRARPGADQAVRQAVDGYLSFLEGQGVITLLPMGYCVVDDRASR